MQARRLPLQLGRILLRVANKVVNNLDYETTFQSESILASERRINSVNKVGAGLIGIGLMFLLSAIAYAGNATWDLNPGSGDWNTFANWTPMTVPNGPADTATLGLSNLTNVSTSENTEVSGITFTAAATNPYTITSHAEGGVLTISGTGITNNSGTTQYFVAALSGFAGGNTLALEFKNSATAGSGIVFTTQGFPTPALASATTVFFDSSSAGNSTFVNTAGGGSTLFADNATASSGTFMNNGSKLVNAAGGSTVFVDSSTAAMGVFTDYPGTISGTGGGLTAFVNSSGAGNAIITNKGATVSGALGGFTQIMLSSTAANAIITNEGGTASGAFGGATQLQGVNPGEPPIQTASAGNATIINKGAAASGASGGNTAFADSSTAGNAIITSEGGTVSGASGGATFFESDSSTAGNATISNNGGAVSGASGGSTTFNNMSTAGNATITNNGGTVSGAGGGSTLFVASSPADSATLIANGGTGGGQGGTILFEDKSTGGTSGVEVFGNGNLDISLHHATGPFVIMAIGSIEGSGNVFLGANNLTVGSNNLSTTFSGVIQDGGQNGGTGGSLTKIGTGTLDLTGANTYTGDTNINGGVLQVDGSITSNTFVNEHGTLAGSGTIDGNVTVTHQIGGMVSPGDAPGTLTINGNYTQAISGTLMIDIAGANTGQFSVLNVLGTANLSGLLDPVLLNGFLPTIGESFTFLDYGSVNGSLFIFDRNIDNAPEHWDVTYQSNDAILTVAAGNVPIPDWGSTFLLLTLSSLGLVTCGRSLFRKQA